MNEEQTAQATALKPGDVVRLKSGGPEMTVKYADPAGTSSDPRVLVIHMDFSGRLGEYTLPASVLESEDAPSRCCGQKDVGQTGEYPCQVCGLPTVHDDGKPGAHVSDESEEAFHAACDPLIKYLAQNHHPHTQVIVTGNSAEMVEGVMSYLNAEYVPD